MYICKNNFSYFIQISKKTAEMMTIELFNINLYEFDNDEFEKRYPTIHKFLLKLRRSVQFG